MSQLEIAKFTAPIYSYTFPVMVAGTISTTNVSATYNASALSRFTPQSSKVLGVVRTTAGGVVGQPLLGVVPNNINSTADGYLPILTLRSSVNTDTSVYTMYWVNELANSQLLSVLGC